MRFPNRPQQGDAPCGRAMAAKASRARGRHDARAGLSRFEPDDERSLDPAIAPAPAPASR